MERATSSGLTSYALRFRALGERQFVHLGYSPDWSRKRAEDELSNVMADVRRGLWRPQAQPEVRADPSFHEFASEWFERRSRELAPRTRDDYEWRLSHHLLPFFARHRLSEITVREVDRYREAKVAESERRRRALDAETARREAARKAGKPIPPRKAPRPLGADSNKTLKLLSAVLEDAVEYELLERNPAKGKRRRLKVSKPRPVHLDSAQQIVALLDAARELDADRLARTSGRYALVATLMFAGPRASEAGAASIRDLDLARARLEVGRSKTAAGMRKIDLLPILRDVLAEHKAGLRGGLDDPLFPTKTGADATRTTSQTACWPRCSSARRSCWPSAISTPSPSV